MISERLSSLCLTSRQMVEDRNTEMNNIKKGTGLGTMVNLRISFRMLLSFNSNEES